MHGTFLNLQGTPSPGLTPGEGLNAKLHLSGIRRVPPEPGLQPEYKFWVRERFPYPNGVRIVVIRGVRVATDRSCSVRETEERDIELSADTR